MSDAPEPSTGWLVAGAATVYGTLTTALASVWKISESKSTRAIESLEKRLEGYAVRLDESDRKHAECLEDRIELSKQIARLEGRLSHFVDHGGSQ